MSEVVVVIEQTEDDGGMDDVIITVYANLAAAYRGLFDQISKYDDLRDWLDDDVADRDTDEPLSNDERDDVVERYLEGRLDMVQLSVEQVHS